MLASLSYLNYLFSVILNRLEQFNDVLLQENVPDHDMNSPLFDLNALNSTLNEGSFSVEAVKVIHAYHAFAFQLQYFFIFYRHIEGYSL